MFYKDRKKFNIYFNVYIKQISYLLRLLGININTVPVLDLRRMDSHNIIGDRSYSDNKNVISITLAKNILRAETAAIASTTILNYNLENN